MKKSLIAMSFGIFCLFCSPAHLTAQDGEDGISPIQTTQLTTRPVLRRGSFGDVVMELQEALVHFGYDPGRPDGDFGRRTEEAVTCFQADNNLTADGVVDEATWAALTNLPNGHQPPIQSHSAKPTAPYSTPEQIQELANHIAFNLISQSEPGAERIVQLVNTIMSEVGSRTQFELRVLSVDGHELPGIDDYRTNRLNLFIENGIIVSADIG